MEQTVNPGTEARAEGAATLTQADLDLADIRIGEVK